MNTSTAKNARTPGATATELSLPDFLAAIQARFHARRLDLLQARVEGDADLSPTEHVDQVRESTWRVADRPSEPRPADVVPRPWRTALVIDGTSMSAALYDVAFAAFHAGDALPHIELPRVVNHREARVWNDVFDYCEQSLGARWGDITATVRLDADVDVTELELLLYELREHVVAVRPARSTPAIEAICAQRGVVVRSTDAD